MQDSLWKWYHTSIFHLPYFMAFEDTNKFSFCYCQQIWAYKIKYDSMNINTNLDFIALLF